MHSFVDVCVYVCAMMIGLGGSSGVHVWEQVPEQGGKDDSCGCRLKYCYQLASCVLSEYLGMCVSDQSSARRSHGNSGSWNCFPSWDRCPPKRMPGTIMSDATPPWTRRIPITTCTVTSWQATWRKCYRNFHRVRFCIWWDFFHPPSFYVM